MFCSSSWKEISEAFTYSRLSSTEMSSIVEAIGCLPPSTPSLTLVREVQLLSFFTRLQFLEVALCSKQGEQQSVRKHQPRMPDSSHHISILSPRFIIFFIDYLLSHSSAVRFLEVTSSANIVTQAGVRVLDISSTTSGKSSVILNEFGGEIGLRLLQGRYVL